MDDDPVLQELGAELERDDPALAALLSGSEAPGSGTPPRRHRVAWTVLALTVVGFCLLLAPATTFGVLSMLLVLASPLLAGWWCAFPWDDPPPHRT